MGSRGDPWDTWNGIPRVIAGYLRGLGMDVTTRHRACVPIVGESSELYILERRAPEAVFSFPVLCCIILRIEAVLGPSTAQHFRGSEALFPEPKLYLRHLLIVLKRLEAKAFWGVLSAS